MYRLQREQNNISRQTALNRLVLNDVMSVTAEIEIPRLF